MASYRLANPDKSLKELILSRSYCPKCHNKLKLRNLIPLFSWILQKGRCEFCQQKISIRYPLIELGTVLLFLSIHAVNQDLDLKLVVLLLIGTVLMIMVINDLEHYFISNVAQISLLILSLIYHLLFENKLLLPHFAISAIIFVIFGLIIKYGFLFLAKKDGLGIDDIKFFGVAGFLLGIEQFPIFMILSGLLGIIFGTIWKTIIKEETFPFAPALSLALILTLILKEKINYFDLL